MVICSKYEYLIYTFLLHIFTRRIIASTYTQYIHTYSTYIHTCIYNVLSIVYTYIARYLYILILHSIILTYLHTYIHTYILTYVE